MEIAEMKIKLPSGWKVDQCKNIIDVRDGTHDTPKYCSSGYPLVTSKNLKPEGIDFSTVSYIAEEDHYEISKRSKVDRGDILFAMIGTIGNPVIVNVDTEFFIKNVALFKFSKSSIDAKYFKYLLETPIITQQLDCGQRGGTQKFVSLKVLRDMLIPYPPLEEQHRIAAILDKADAVRRKRQQAIALTEELLRSAFLEMFGDPVTNPKGWEVVALGNISKIQGGLQVTSQRNTNPLEAPYLRVANVYRDKLVLDEIKFIRVTQQELKRAMLCVGDLLIVEGHGNNREVGRSSVWDGSIPNCTHQNHLICVRLDSKIANSTYISAFLNSSGGRRQLNKFGKTTSGLNTISTSNVKATKVLLPPLPEQKKYSEVKQKFAKCLDLEREHFQNTDNLFNSLLQRAFQGKL